MEEGDYQGALDLAQFRAAEAEEVLGTDNPLLASALKNLGDLQSTFGQTSEAIETLERALALVLAAEEPAAEVEIQILDTLTSIYFNVGDLTAARDRAERAVASSIPLLGGWDARTESSRTNLAVIIEFQGDIPAAQRILESMLEARVTRGKPLDLMYAEIAAHLARILRTSGQIERAVTLARNVLQIRQKVLPAGDHLIGAAYNDLGNYEMDRGNHPIALELLLRASEISGDAVGRDHPDFATTLANLGGLHQVRGDFAASRRLLEQAIAIKSAALGPDHVQVGRDEADLGQLMIREGDAKGALALYTRLLENVREQLGETHPLSGVYLNNISQAQYILDDPAAGETMRKAMEMMIATRGPTDPFIAGGYQNMAMLEAEAGDFERAEDGFAKALEIAEAAWGPENRAEADILINLGSMRLNQGRVEEAIEILERAEQVNAAVFGPKSGKMATVLTSAALAAEENGDDDRARALRQRALDISIAFTDRTLAGMAEYEALLYTAGQAGVLRGYLRSFSGPHDHRKAYEAVLYWKGLVGRTMAARHESVVVGDAHREIHAELMAHRQRLARAALSGLPEETIGALTKAKEAAERQLAEQVPGMDSERVDLDDLCAAVPDGAALVDYLRLQDRQDPIYLAFVLTRTCEPILLDLGPAAPIDEAAAAWHQSLADTRAASSRLQARGERLRDAIWTPLSDAVGDAELILIAPDAGLASVPFAALPIASGFLIEERSVAYVDSATNIVRPPVDRKVEGALLVGDVNYSNPDGEPRKAPCVDASWGRLPATADELEDVTARFTKRHRGEPTVVLTGSAATEASVAGALSGRRLVHLATHGFFADPRQCPSVLSIGQGHNPMVLSGLALAGESGADGILTAEEVVSLDLRGTELVVLSACETGLGETLAGEGVLGLRRAFSTAGAQSLLMSLWAIPDEATAELMSSFYRRALARRHRGRAEALRQAQLDLLRDRREEGDPRPQDWAGFVIAGDWR